VLDELTASQTYKTLMFEPELTYRVPAPGWHNWEDIRGNFLLVPPGNDLSGVDAGTADYLGVYTSVAPMRIINR
jgi:hypothetical protein